MNIVFTGLRGTGKTTLGRALAESLNWPFIDLDEEIERILNKKIVQFIEEGGWEPFRALEKQVARKAAKKEKTVISTGGGTLIDPENADVLKKNGHVVLLVCDMKQLKETLEKSHARPSLTGQKDAIEELEEIWEQRKKQYHALADTIHDNTGWPPVEDLLEKLKAIPHLL
jgi:shikimate kinase